MTDDRMDEETKHVLVRRLVRETGVKAKDARQIVEQLGPNWTHLVRRARMVRNHDHIPEWPVVH